MWLELQRIFETTSDSIFAIFVLVGFFPPILQLHLIFAYLQINMKNESKSEAHFLFLLITGSNEIYLMLIRRETL